MPIKIIDTDITAIHCDAIVNPTNRYMRPGGGADAAIHAAAGPRLREFCARLGGVSVGEAKITPAFDLPCKYVIHTAGPEWQGGLSGERVLLRSCYKESMRLAIQHGCKSVAFPLIASGAYGYPKDKVLKEAMDVLNKFLKYREMDVYIVVYGKSSYSIGGELFDDISEFIERFYADERRRFSIDSCMDEATSYSYRVEKATCKERPCSPMQGVHMSAELPPKNDGRFGSRRLNDMLKNMDKSFGETLLDYIDKKGVSDVEAYKRSNVSRKTFSKIKCNPSHKPSKQTAVSFAIGLHLNIDEATHLLSTAGIALSHAEKFDVIIEYFILTGKYETIHDVNAVLYQFDQLLLGTEE